MGDAGSGADWSAAKYLKFGDERTRPARDLLAALSLDAPRRVIDLGCGPGNSTELLSTRFADATVEGLDSSPEMLAQASARLPDIAFVHQPIEHWRPEHAYDLVFSNAALQWLPDHASLFPKLLEKLAPGGSLAIQMPDNMAEPSHTTVDEIAAASEWAGRLRAGHAERRHVLTPAQYYSLLAPLSARLDIWRTTYFHALAGPDDIVAWFKGSRLRPYLNLLHERERVVFLDRYRALIAERYPRQSDGRVLLAMPRLFIVATR